MRLRVSSAKDCVFRGAWRLSRLQPPQLASVPPATQTSRAPLVPHRLLGRGTSYREYAQETRLDSWPLRVIPDASLRNRALAVMPVISAGSITPSQALDKIIDPVFGRARCSVDALGGCHVSIARFG